MTAPACTELSDVIANVCALLAAVGDARPLTGGDGVELLIGERYLQQEGAPPRVIFVPSQEGGAIGPILAAGARQVASMAESVTCYVWGPETSDDATRFDAARALCRRLINCFKCAAPGRMTGGAMVRANESHILTYGEEYQLTLSFVFGVPYDDDIWEAAYALAQTQGTATASPPDPDRPAGSTGKSFETTITVKNERA